MMSQLRPVRDKLLTHAKVAEGDSVLDIGCGDGLLGFGAASLIGEAGEVILCDISRDALAYCEEFIRSSGLGPNIRTLESSAADLGAVADSSVDVVLSRACLMYVADKAQCFREIHRVLKPGGRLALLDTINRFGHVNIREKNSLDGFDLSGIPMIAEKISSGLGGKIDPDMNILARSDERDYFNYAVDAGFYDVSLEYHANRIHIQEKWGYEAFITRRGNPLAKTTKEAMDATLSEAEKKEFEEYLRPLLEQGKRLIYNAGAYITAVKASGE